MIFAFLSAAWASGVCDTPVEIPPLVLDQAEELSHDVPSPVGERAYERPAEPGDTRGIGVSGRPPGASYHESFVVADHPPVDILFAVDKSGSMAADILTLEAGFESFITELEGTTINWQVGIATKMTTNTCFNVGILDSSTDDLVETVKLALKVTGTTPDVGETPSTEMMLQLASKALETTEGGCNDGFLRDNAVLHVVVVSDEDEQSGVDWSVWVDDYLSHKLQPWQVKVHGIVADPDGGSCASEGADGYLQAIGATGGAQLDLCSADWGAQLPELAAAAKADLGYYPLEYVPEEGSVSVVVDGTTLTEWWFDATHNAIRLCVPVKPGSTLSIYYAPTL
jgi:hypothetical protein